MYTSLQVKLTYDDINLVFLQKIVEIQIILILCSLQRRYLFFLVLCFKETAQWLELTWWMFVYPQPKEREKLTILSYFVAFIYLDFGFQVTTSSLSFVLSVPIFSSSTLTTDMSSLISSIVVAFVVFLLSSFFSISAENVRIKSWVKREIKRYLKRELKRT